MTKTTASIPFEKIGYGILIRGVLPGEQYFLDRIGLGVQRLTIGHAEQVYSANNRLLGRRHICGR